jgi:hypothetical protein
MNFFYGQHKSRKIKEVKQNEKEATHVRRDQNSFNIVECITQIVVEKCARIKVALAWFATIVQRRQVIFFTITFQ